MKRKFVEIVILLLAIGCGREDNKSVSDQTRTGIYTLGDKVRYKVTRQGYGNPVLYITEGKVISIDGAAVKIEWRDLFEADFSLIEWKQGANPEIKTIDYNAQPQVETQKRECTREPQTSLHLSAPAGEFECLQYQGHRI